MKSITKGLLISLIIPTALLVFNIAFFFINGTICDFLTTPLYAIINIFIALIFAYYYTHRKNDSRKKKEIIEGMITKILNSFDNKSMRQIRCDEDIDFIRITQRSVSNRLQLLKEFEKEFKYSEDIKYVIEQYESYWGLISNHISNLDYLKDTDKDLLNFCSNITNGLEKIVVKIYKV